MEHYYSIQDLDIAIWTVDYLTATDELEMGVISKKEKQHRQDDIIRQCVAKYGTDTLLTDAIFGEPQS